MPLMMGLSYVREVSLTVEEVFLADLCFCTLSEEAILTHLKTIV